MLTMTSLLLESGLIGWAVGNYLRYQYAFIYFKVQLRDGQLVDGIKSHAQLGTGNISFVDQFLDNRHSGIDADGISHALHADTGYFGAGDADYFSGQVDQRTAAVARVNGGARLDKVIERLRPGPPAVKLPCG